MSDTQRDAFTAGWNASKRTTTYDLEAAEQRYEKKHGNTTGTAFAAGWTAYAAGSHNSLKLAWLAHEQERKAQAKADDLTPAGVQLAIDAELAQADAELAAVKEPAEAENATTPPIPYETLVYEMSWGRLEQLVAGAKANQHASTALHQIDYLTEVIQQAELMRDRAVKVARQDGESWAAVGAQLGSTKQAAQQRYGKKP